MKVLLGIGSYTNNAGLSLPRGTTSYVNLRKYPTEIQEVNGKNLTNMETWRSTMETLKELVKILSVEIIDTHIYLNKFKGVKCQWRNCIDDSLTW